MHFKLQNFFAKIVRFNVEKFVEPDRPWMKRSRTRIACWIL